MENSASDSVCNFNGYYFKSPYHFILSPTTQEPAVSSHPGQHACYQTSHLSFRQAANESLLQVLFPLPLILSETTSPSLCLKAIYIFPPKNSPLLAKSYQLAPLLFQSLNLTKFKFKDRVLPFSFPASVYSIIHLSTLKWPWASCPWLHSWSCPASTLRSVTSGILITASSHLGLMLSSCSWLFPVSSPLLASSALLGCRAPL